MTTRVWDTPKATKIRSDGLGLRFKVKGHRLICFHDWKWDTSQPVWHYRECLRCEQREVLRRSPRIIGPVDWRWLLRGDAAHG